MIRPLRDYIVVEPLEERLSEVIEVVRLGREGKHARGRIVAVGPQVKFNDRLQPRVESDSRVGDVIQFTDIFKFPVIMDRGEKRLILQEADICGIEEREEDHAAA